MKVNLAKDVMSSQVGNNLQTMPGAEGTAEFVLMIDRYWVRIQNHQSLTSFLADGSR